MTTKESYKLTELNQLFHPVTAVPTKKNCRYIEILPCDILRPYIRCFWGMEKSIIVEKTDIITRELVIPDTCMDIIFDMNYTENRIDSKFCGINDKTFEIVEKNDKTKEISSFAIRFYAWTAILFAEEDMKDIKNKFFDVSQYFSKIKKQIEPYLFETLTIQEYVDIVEKILISNLHLKYRNPIVEEAIFQMLTHYGNIKVFDIAKEIHISTRQLERIFKENIGISPKKMSSLIRYQYLWNDIVFGSNINIQDAVIRYGYTDQSHLLRDFKHYHTMLPHKAKKLACLESSF